MRKKRAAICVLTSGGLDSAVLVAEFLRRGRTVYPVYIRQGLAWEPVELYWLRCFLRAIRRPSLRPLEVFSLPMSDVYGDHWSVGHHSVPGSRSPDKAVYLPGRNLILLVKAAVFCALHKIPEIALAPLAQNPFPDATRGFFRSWSSTLSLGLASPIHIQTPYQSLSKVEVIRRGRDLPLENTFSCLAPRGRLHCGRCNKCAERRKAFRVAGVNDPTRYASR